jgi:hypothetical protein
MATQDPGFMDVAAVAGAWLLLMWGVRFSVSAGSTLVPLAQAGGRIVRHSMAGRDATREWTRAFDEVFLTLNMSLIKPWAVVMLLGGMVLMGMGYGFNATGDVALLVSPAHSARLIPLDRVLDLMSAVFGALGMAGGLAAISPKPTTSMLISLGFTLAGIGIGVISFYF